MSTAPLPDEAAPGRLIAFRADRLGARLVSLMNAMRLAEDLGADFGCAWTDTTGVGHVFNDPCELFADDFVAQHFLTADEWRAQRPATEPLNGPLQQQPGAVAAALAAGRDVIVGNAFGVIALAGETVTAVTPYFRAQFGRIPFAAPVQAAMDRLSDELTGHTAYHIRRGDLTGDPKAMNKPWPHKMVPNEFYERHMQVTLGGGQGGAVLFSDDAETIAHYRAAYPALRTLEDLIDTDSLTEAQRDLVELYAMSRCATIIAPERSAFSSTAADLSGAEKHAVTECLSPADREAALQALHDRLRDRPESFAGDGEIGQCLAHVGKWLEAEDRWHEAADLFGRRVADGLNISFVYPKTMEYQHRAGDAAGVIETARHMRSRSVMHVKDQAAAEILHGYAHLRRGDHAPGLRHIVNGFWHGPQIPTARSVIPLLIAIGRLNPQNFLPSSEVQLSLLRRRGPLKTLFVDFPDLVAMDGTQVPGALGAMEPVLWDWAPLMRSLSVAAQVRRGAVGRFADALAALPDDPATQAERRSIAVLYAGFGGDAERAAEALQDLARDHPDEPMVLHRLSHAWWLARRFRKAAEAAGQVAEMRPDWVAVRAWAGMTHLRIRQREMAHDHLQAAAAADCGLPSIHALLSDCLERMGQPAAALAEIDRALDLAPLEVDHAMRAARLLEKTGDPRAGVGRLLPVVEAERAPAKLFIQLIELLERLGDTAEVAEAIRLARVRSPDHPMIVDLGARLAPDGPPAD